jgi:hypothetical protein
VSFFFFGVPTSLPEKLGAEERLGLNLKDLRSWKKNCPGVNPSNHSGHPGRVTLGFVNIPAAPDRVNPSKIACSQIFEASRVRFSRLAGWTQALLDRFHAERFTP